MDRMTALVSIDISATIEGRFRSELEQRRNSQLVQLQFGFPALNQMEAVNDIIKEACVKRLEEECQDGCHLYQYGSQVGDPVFRDCLAKLLTKAYGYEVKRDSLMATNGASFFLSHLGAMFFRSGDMVFAEEPSYPLALDTLKQNLSMTVVQVPMDENGILTSDLEMAIKQYYPGEGFTPSGDRPYWSLLYLIPTFHNPTGFCLSEERCKDVITLARKYHLLVVCDDVYALIRWDVSGNEAGIVSPPKLLKYYDNEDDPDFFGNVVSNCSFSKILAPGLRLGWVDAPRVVMEKFVRSALLTSGGDFNHFTSGIVAKVMELGRIDQLIENACSLYKENLLTVHTIFQKRLKGIVRYTLPKGGFFLWVQLPDHVNSQDLHQLCLKKYKVQISTGSSFTRKRGNPMNCIRLCFTFLDNEQIAKGVERLSSAILELHEQKM